MNTRRKQYSDIFLIIFSCIAVYSLIWAFTSEGPFKSNPYNSYILQARAWLNGHLDLGKNYEHLELAVFKDKYFVSFPPLPSVLLLPFAIFNTPDNLASVIVSCSVCIYAYKLCREFVPEHARFIALFLSIASNVLIVSINSWVWFIAQNFSLLFTLMSFYFAKNNKGHLSLACLSFAVLCRPFQIVYFPMLCMILSGGKNRLWKCFTVPVILGIACMIFNFVRFGNPLEFGHNYLPEFTASANGQFDISYIPQNAPSLIRLPSISESGILTFPKFNGMSIFLCFPIVIFCLAFSLVKITAPQTLVGLLTVFVHVLLLLSHKTMGGFHFGNRYFIDVMPMLFYLLLYNFPRNHQRFTKIMIPFFIFGLCLNTIGAIEMFS